MTVYYASYYFTLAAPGKDPAGTLEVQMTRAPASHVEPLNRPGGARPILSVQEDQLLQCPNCCVLQHLLQLEGTTRRWTLQSLFVTRMFVPLSSVRHTHTSPRAGSWSPKPTMRMQSACRMQR